MILTIKLRLFVQVGNFLPFLCEKIFHKVEDKYTPVSGLCWSASTPCSTIRVQTGYLEEAREIIEKAVRLAPTDSDLARNNLKELQKAEESG